MKAIVFAGPSLHGVALDPARTWDLAPPASCGDILRAVAAGRRVIGLVDGAFEDVPAVWHKEIMVALSEGCSVLGAASMGALRAAECCLYGMMGVGRIFEDYRSGRRVADADVALLHGPAELGYPVLTVTLADAEDAIERLTAEGALRSGEASRLLGAARALFYKDRTWESICDAAGLSNTRSETIENRIGALGPSLKTRDALELLARIEAGIRVCTPRIDPVCTHFLTHLRARLEI